MSGRILIHQVAMCFKCIECAIVLIVQDSTATFFLLAMETGGYYCPTSSAFAALESISLVEVIYLQPVIGQLLLSSNICTAMMKRLGG